MRTGLVRHSLANYVGLAGMLLWITLGGCAVASRQTGPVTGPVLFTDGPQSNAGRWELDPVQSRWLAWSFTAGNLHVSRTPAVVPFSGPIRFGLPIPVRLPADVSLEVQIHTNSQTTGIGCGIFVDRPSRNDRYYFELDPYGNSSISVEKLAAGQSLAVLQGPKPLSGIDRNNRIGITRLGSRLTFLVNGTEVAAVDAMPSEAGPMGLFAEVLPGSAEEDSVDFSNLVIRQP